MTDSYQRIDWPTFPGRGDWGRRPLEQVGAQYAVWAPPRLSAHRRSACGLPFGELGIFRASPELDRIGS